MYETNTPLDYTESQAPQRYAGFWERFAAAFIDGIVTGVASNIITYATLGVTDFSDSEPISPYQDPADQLIAIYTGMLPALVISTVMSWLYSAFMESSANQGTLGKMALNIKVTDLYGERISFGRATGRFFAKYISAFTLLIGYIMAAFTERKQALHDMIAGTLVMKK